MHVESVIHRSAIALLLLAVPPACVGEARAEMTPEARQSESDASSSAFATTGERTAQSEDVIRVTILDTGGSELGSFHDAQESMDWNRATITHAGNLTSVIMSLAGTGAEVATTTLKTHAPGPGEVKLDDEGEGADALRLVFWIAKGPDGVSGQYESMEGTAQLTAVNRDHVTGTFDGTFVRQHSDTSFRVRGSFDFKRAR